MASGQVWSTIGFGYISPAPQLCVIWESEWTEGNNHIVHYHIVAYNHTQYRMRFDVMKPGGAGGWCYNWIEPNSSGILDLEGTTEGNSSGVYNGSFSVTSDSSGICTYISRNIYGYARIWRNSTESTSYLETDFLGVQLDRPGDYHIYISTPDGINCWTSTGIIAYIDDPFSVHCLITADHWGDYDISISGVLPLDNGLFEPYQDVYITVTGIYKKYKLTIENPEGVSIIAEDLNTSEVYTNGDMVQHFTVLDVYCIVDDRYSLEELYIDSNLCTEHTYYQVLSEVALSAKSSCPGAVWINTNGTPVAYYPFIFDGSSWNRYVPYIYDASSDVWIGCK